MARKSATKDLYVSFSPMVYMAAKQGVLKTEEDLLVGVKHLNNLKKIKKEKSRLKLELFRLFERVSRDLDSLDKELPNPKVPKQLQHNVTKTPKKVEVSIDYGNDEDDRVERELLEIREKLKKLNSN